MNNYLKKLHILQRILANYHSEIHALTLKNPQAYRHVLQERKALIIALKMHPFKIPETPLEKLQQFHMNQLIEEIQVKRRASNRFLL